MLLCFGVCCLPTRNDQNKAINLPPNPPTTITKPTTQSPYTHTHITHEIHPLPPIELWGGDICGERKTMCIPVRFPIHAETNKTVVLSPEKLCMCVCVTSKFSTVIKDGMRRQIPREERHRFYPLICELHIYCQPWYPQTVKSIMDECAHHTFILMPTLIANLNGVVYEGSRRVKFTINLQSTFAFVFCDL